MLDASKCRSKPDEGIADEGTKNPPPNPNGDSEVENPLLKPLNPMSAHAAETVAARDGKHLSPRNDCETGNYCEGH